MAGFAELGLCSELVRAVDDLGWSLPTPVQQEAVPLILGGGDVLAAAETGSGKTGAFALPVLQITHETLRQQASATSAKGESACRTSGSDSQDAIGIGEDREGLLTVSADGLTCACDAAGSWAGGRANVGVLGGTHFYEAEQAGGGLLRLGWSTLNARLALGTCAYGYGYGGTGKKSNAKRFDSYGEEARCSCCYRRGMAEMSCVGVGVLCTALVRAVR